MDNRSSHLTSDAIRLLTNGRVRVINFAQQATQIFQALDVALFRAVKWHPRSELPFGDEKATIQCIVKGDPDFKQIIVEAGTCGVVEALGFEFGTKTERYRLYSMRKR